MTKSKAKNTARPKARKQGSRPVARNLPLHLGQTSFEQQFLVTTTTTIVPRKTG